MFTMGWLIVLLGVLAIRWADKRFPFSTHNLLRRRWLYRLNQRRIVSICLSAIHALRYRPALQVIVRHGHQVLCTGLPA
jgi:hypothetical protein